MLGLEICTRFGLKRVDMYIYIYICIYIYIYVCIYMHMYWFGEATSIGPQMFPFSLVEKVVYSIAKLELRRPVAGWFDLSLDQCGRACTMNLRNFVNALQWHRFPTPVDFVACQREPAQPTTRPLHFEPKTRKNRKTKIVQHNEATKHMGVDQKGPLHGMTIGGNHYQDDNCHYINGKRCSWSFGGQEY